MSAANPPTERVLYAEQVVLGRTGDSLRVAPARIHVSGTRFTEVVEQSRPEFETWALTHHQTVTDLGHRLVSPAFINGHTHLAMAAFRGLGSGAAFEHNVVEDLYYALESGLTPEDVRAFTRLGAYESLLCGVGLVWDHYYGGEGIAEALRDTGLAGVVAPTLQDVSGPGSQAWPAQLAATAVIDEGTEWRRVGVFAAVGPHATDTVSDTLFERARSLATERELPMHLHLAQSLEEYERSLRLHGLSPTERLHRVGLLASPARALLVHVLFVTDDDLRRLDPERHLLGYCPQSQVRFAFPALPTRWEHARLRWVLGTDCAPCNDSMNVQKELRAAAGAALHAVPASEPYLQFCKGGTLAEAKAVADRRSEVQSDSSALRSPDRLLSSVWSQPGSAHPKFMCGAIAAGHLANLVVWDLDHPAFWPPTDPLRLLAYGDTTGAIDWMLVAGSPVGQRGRFAASLIGSGEHREARREAEARLRRHLSRIGVTTPEPPGA